MTIIDEAKELIEGQRRIDYGDAGDCFDKISSLWSTYLGKRLQSDLTSFDVINMMILLKVARNSNGVHTRDTYVDIVGYAALSEVIELGQMT